MDHRWRMGRPESNRIMLAAAAHPNIRFWATAEIDRSPAPIVSVANEPIAEIGRLKLPHRSTPSVPEVLVRYGTVPKFQARLGYFVTPACVTAARYSMGTRAYLTGEAYRETTRIHYASRRRGDVAARGACAGAEAATCRLFGRSLIRLRSCENGSSFFGGPAKTAQPVMLLAS